MSLEERFIAECAARGIIARDGILVPPGTTPDNPDQWAIMNWHFDANDSVGSAYELVQQAFEAALAGGSPAGSQGDGG